MTSSTSEKRVTAPDSAEAILGEVGTLLRDLTEIQSSLLSVLKQKRDAMATGALDSLNDLQRIEEEIHRRLKACYDRRSEILERGCSQGLEGDTLAELTQQISEKNQADVGNLPEKFQESKEHVRRLQLEHLTNWVIAQKSLLHVSQILEIVATGGKIQPTYGKSESSARGALVDQEA